MCVHTQTHMPTHTCAHTYTHAEKAFGTRRKLKSETKIRHDFLVGCSFDCLFLKLVALAKALEKSRLKQLKYTTVSGPKLAVVESCIEGAFSSVFTEEWKKPYQKTETILALWWKRTRSIYSADFRIAMDQKLLFIFAFLFHVKVFIAANVLTSYILCFRGKSLSLQLTVLRMKKRETWT